MLVMEVRQWTSLRPRSLWTLSVLLYFDVERHSHGGRYRSQTQRNQQTKVENPTVEEQLLCLVMNLWMCLIWKVGTPIVFNEWELPPSVASRPDLKWEFEKHLYSHIHPSTPPPHMHTPPKLPKQRPVRQRQVTMYWGLSKIRTLTSVGNILNLNNINIDLHKHNISLSRKTLISFLHLLPLFIFEGWET